MGEQWDFEIGRNYIRKEDIHAKYKGQRQSGIITPASHPIVFAITAKKGKKYGYEDRELPDGTLLYYGEGQKGPMKWDKGNKALRDHSINGKDLLVFQKARPGAPLIFRGEYVCEGWEETRSKDREGKFRKSFVFRLKPLAKVANQLERQPTENPESFADLRQKAYDAAGIRPGKDRQRTVYERSKDIRDYVLTRAACHCEACKREASFKRKNGTPYLEVHHVRRISDGGPDDPRFVIGLCETCHRRSHFAHDGAEFNQGLFEVIQRIEGQLTAMRNDHGSPPT